MESAKESKREGESTEKVRRDEGVRERWRNRNKYGLTRAETLRTYLRQQRKQKVDFLKISFRLGKLGPKIEIWVSLFSQYFLV